MSLSPPIRGFALQLDTTLSGNLQSYLTPTHPSMFLPSFLSLYDTFSICHLLYGMSFPQELHSSSCSFVLFSISASHIVGLPQSLLDGCILSQMWHPRKGTQVEPSPFLILPIPLHSYFPFFSALKSCPCLRM